MSQLPMGTPASVREVYITSELKKRPARERNYIKEKLAIQDIAGCMASDPSQVLPRLVDLSMDLCDAVAGGISNYEEADHAFRWHHLRGALEKFSGQTTPRHYSPCGVAIDGKSPVLVQRPERVYTWLAEADVSLPECLLVPLSIGADEPIGTIWIVSKDVGHFTESHSQTLQDIAAFAAIALQMKRCDERLRSALDEQKVITREMSHRVKNLFSIIQSMVPVAAQRSSTTEEMAVRLSARLTALARANALVRPAPDADGKDTHAAELTEVVSAVMRPYENASINHGPILPLGERGTNMIALVLYELATNASKYGALSTETGIVTIDWSTLDGNLTMRWVETGGPALAGAPPNAGFGTNLVAKALAYSRGTIAYHWLSAGLAITIVLPQSSIAE